MIMLKRLEIVGFKSFAKKTEILFNTPITAIVGPNGSGKSNIAEAFSFALGEQSIKRAMEFNVNIFMLFWCHILTVST